MIPVGTNLSVKNIPWATLSLLLANWIVFLLLHDVDYSTQFWIDQYLCTVPGDQHPWQLITHMFLHADIFHILGNSLFLWVFGVFVEDKLGWKVYLFLYFLTGVAANLVHGTMTGFFMRDELLVPGLGASGAISGLMGIYLYRCYYSKIRLLVGLFFPVRIEVPTLLILSCWFLKDIVGGISSIRGLEGNIAFWAHVGGFAAGLGASKYLCYEREARKEKLEFVLERGIEGFEGAGEAIDASEKLLRSDPEHVQAHLHLARARSRWRASREGKEHYEKTIKLLLEKDPDKAVEVFVEYWKQYISAMEPRFQVRLSLLLVKHGYADLATRALEVLVSSDQPLNLHMEKAYLYLARLYRENLKLEDLARHTYERFLKEFPKSGERVFVQQKLGLTT